MRISDWSSDVCSSDLWPDKEGAGMMSSMHKNTVAFAVLLASAGTVAAALKTSGPANPLPAAVQSAPAADRKSVVSGKRVSVRVDLGGRRILKKKKKENIESIL